MKKVFVVILAIVFVFSIKATVLGLDSIGLYGSSCFNGNFRINEFSDSLTAPWTLNTAGIEFKPSQTFIIDLELKLGSSPGERSNFLSINPVNFSSLSVQFQFQLIKYLRFRMNGNMLFVTSVLNKYQHGGLLSGVNARFYFTKKAYIEGFYHFPLISQTGSDYYGSDYYLGFDSGQGISFTYLINYHIELYAGYQSTNYSYDTLNIIMDGLTAGLKYSFKFEE